MGTAKVVADTSDTVLLLHLSDELLESTSIDPLERQRPNMSPKKFLREMTAGSKRLLHKTYTEKTRLYTDLVRIRYSATNGIKTSVTADLSSCQFDSGRYHNLGSRSILCPVSQPDGDIAEGRWAQRSWGVLCMKA